MSKEIKNTIPNIWSAQENLIHLYKRISVAFAILGICLAAFAIMVSFRDPIVILQSDSGQRFFQGSRKRVAVGREDVEEWTKQFLQALYVWSSFDGQTLSKELSPYMDESLISKVVNTQGEKYSGDLGGKKLEQALAFVRVEVKEDRVEAQFERILKISGVSLVIPTQVSLSMVQGRPSRPNPMGVYISGIVENEGSN